MSSVFSRISSLALGEKYNKELKINIKIDGSVDVFQFFKLHDQELPSFPFSTHFAWVDENILEAKLVSCGLRNIPRGPGLFHAFVIVKTDHYFVSLEKMLEGILIQVSTEESFVKDHLDDMSRPTEVKDLKTAEGQGTLRDLIKAIYKENHLSRPYHFMWENCKYFSSAMFTKASGVSADCLVGPFKDISHPCGAGPKMLLDLVGKTSQECNYRTLMRSLLTFLPFEGETNFIGFLKAQSRNVSPALIITSRYDENLITIMIKQHKKGFDIKVDDGISTVQSLCATNDYKLCEVIMPKVEEERKPSSFIQLLKTIDTMMFNGAVKKLTKNPVKFLANMFDSVQFEILKSEDRKAKLESHCPAPHAEFYVRPFGRRFLNIRWI